MFPIPVGVKHVAFVCRCIKHPRCFPGKCLLRKSYRPTYFILNVIIHFTCVTSIQIPLLIYA